MQTKEEIQDVMKSNSGREVVELILKNLVPKFGNARLKHDPYQIASKLRIQNNGLFKKLHAQAKDERHTLQFLTCNFFDRLSQCSPRKTVFLFNTRCQWNCLSIFNFQSLPFASSNQVLVTYSL